LAFGPDRAAIAKSPAGRRPTQNFGPHP